MDEGTIVTIFRSRLRPEAADEYAAQAARIEGLARAMPGFVSFDQFESADGERVSIVTFADRSTHDAWRDHPEHREVQRLGRERFYASYDVSVTALVQHRRFEA